MKNKEFEKSRKIRKQLAEERERAWHEEEREARHRHRRVGKLEKVFWAVVALPIAVMCAWTLVMVCWWLLPISGLILCFLLVAVVSFLIGHHC